MSLHRAETADWSKIPPNQYNWWQRQAARTHGIGTPGNLISLLGGGLVLYGLYEIVNHELLMGIMAICFGRCADVMDGVVAEHTKTKSPLGEAVDATIDKTVLGFGLIVFLSFHLVPWLVGVAMVMLGSYNILLAAISSWRHVKLHPSKSGKFATVAEWFAIGLFLIAASLKDQGYSHDIIFEALAYPFFSVFIVLAVHSSISYTRQLHKKVR